MLWRYGKLTINLYKSRHDLTFYWGSKILFMSEDFFPSGSLVHWTCVAATHFWLTKLVTCGTATASVRKSISRLDSGSCISYVFCSLCSLGRSQLSIQIFFVWLFTLIFNAYGDVQFPEVNDGLQKHYLNFPFFFQYSIGFMWLALFTWSWKIQVVCGQKNPKWCSSVPFENGLRLNGRREKPGNTVACLFWGFSCKSFLSQPNTYSTCQCKCGFHTFSQGLLLVAHFSIFSAEKTMIGPALFHPTCHSKSQRPCSHCG